VEAGPADLNPQIMAGLDITIVPITVGFGREKYRDGVTLTEDAFLARLKAQSHVFPKTIAPTVDEFESVYAALAKSTSSIISIHLSGRLGGTCLNAYEAKDRYTVRDVCRVTVIDSRLTSLGLGFAVLEAAKAANAGKSLDEIARMARGMLSQTHVLFFVDTLDYLQHGGRISKIQALWGSVTGIKPLLRLDDGEIVLMEKVRTRAKALERLHEFVADFPQVERLGIVYSTTANEANNLARRLESIVPRDRVIITRYGPGLSCHLGPGALGVIVYEGLE
jgi:DegV family protein with EDD domain